MHSAAQLNVDQSSAVNASILSPLCVLAGPGSGKTFVILHRLGYIRQQLRSDSKRILALTFSKSAATEMSNRLSAVGMRSQDTLVFEVMTFHGFGLRLLNKYWLRLGFSSKPQVLSNYNAKKILKVWH